MTLAVATSPRSLWYLTRGLGAVTLVLLTLSVVLGILDSQRFNVRPRLPRFVVDGLHRNVSLLVLVALALHVMTSLIDAFAPINLVDTVVPFISRYRPLWLGLGAIALDLLVAIAITSVVRARLGFRAWRAVHWLAYACWPVALVHGLGTGSDASQGWMLVLSAACIVAVLAAIVWRAASGWPAHRRIKSAALAATIVGPVALIAWLLAGPLGPGWARRAGTPPSLLAAVGAGQAAPARSTSFRAPFSAQLNGSFAQHTTNGGATAVVAIRATISGGANGSLNVTLSGQPLPDGSGVSMSSSDVTMGPPSNPTLYHGRITSLAGSRLNAHVSSHGGTSVALVINLSLDGSGGASGTLSATPGSQQ